MAVPAEDDWLSSICPYLQSEDGTYRSNEPDDGHRCTAQDPPGTLPMAFQGRFCLTDQHPRCEMYKYAQEMSTLGAVPADEFSGSTAQPSDRAVSLKLGSSGVGGSSRRTGLIAAAGIGGLAIIVFAFVLLMGSCSSEPAPAGPEASPDPQATGEPTGQPESTPTPEPEPTAPADPTPTPEPGASSEASEPPGEPEIEILYQIQEGEALLKIADAFEITRRRILRSNPGLEEIAPADLAGQIIVIPVPAQMTIEEIEAMPGYQGLAP
jgi:hypothetical protein